MGGRFREVCHVLRDKFWSGIEDVDLSAERGAAGDGGIENPEIENAAGWRGGFYRRGIMTAVVQRGAVSSALAA